MKAIRTGFLLLIVGAVAITPAAAQFSMSAGPTLGLNFNLHGGSDLPESGTGLGMVLGGVADIRFSSNVGILATLYFYDVRSGSYTYTNNSLGTPIDIKVSGNLAYFQIEPLFKYELPSGLFMIAGPNLGFNISGEGESEIKTGGYTFQNGQTTQTQTLKDLNARFEIKGGAGYEYPLSPGMTLAPQLTFGYGISNVQSNVAWKVSTFQLLVALKFDVIK
jgi:hypothetical protein